MRTTIHKDAKRYCLNNAFSKKFVEFKGRVYGFELSQILYIVNSEQVVVSKVFNVI